MERDNALTRLLKVKYPVIQAPMLGVTSPEMVAAISNAGGLGSLPVGGLSPEKTGELILKVKSLTDKPFSINLFAHNIPDFDIVEIEKMRIFLEDVKTISGLDYVVPETGTLSFYTYKDQIDILIKHNIPVVSFTFGIPNDASLAMLKANGTILIGTATCTDEAILLAQKGVDAITAQGIEAGGHRGTFIDGPLPQIGLMALVPQIADVVNVPIIASGAINSGATIKASFMLGAMGIQIGTAFIASDESIAIPSYKNALTTAKDTDSKLTKAYSGRWARGINNNFMKLLENSGLKIPPYPIHNSLTGTIRQAAQKIDNGQYTNLWSGQASAGLKALPVTEIFETLIKDAGL